MGHSAMPLHFRKNLAPEAPISWVPHSCAFFAKEWDSTDVAYSAFFPLLLGQWKAPPFRAGRERMGHPLVLGPQHVRMQYNLPCGAYLPF